MFSRGLEGPLAVVDGHVGITSCVFSKYEFCPLCSEHFEGCQALHLDADAYVGDRNGPLSIAGLFVLTTVQLWARA